MNARDELAKLLFVTDNSRSKNPDAVWGEIQDTPALTKYVYAMADAVIAAGYRKSQP